MGQLTHTCPHCHTKNSAFISFAEKEHPRKRMHKIVALYCNGCYEGILLHVLDGAQAGVHNQSGDIRTLSHVKILSIHPKPSEIKIPQYLPENIDKFYKQAAESVKLGHYDASGTMSRKSLDVATKVLNPSGKGNLYKRIENLAEKGMITSDLKGWAHIIRDDGNGSAHDEEPTTKEYAEELLSFTEMFLMYAFTMPQMVKDKRGDNVTKLTEQNNIKAGEAA